MMRATLLLLLTSCAAHRPFDADTVWDDDDRHAIERPPEVWIPNYWTAIDHAVFRPITRLLRVHRRRPAVNANAFGEVPDSSWYTNRLGLYDLSPEEVARGPCASAEMDTAGPWAVVAGKIGGIQQGFFVEDPAGTRYLLKLDAMRVSKVRGDERGEQRERATTADVVGSLIYWAGGYHVPCNRIVLFDPEILEISPDAEYRNSLGEMVPLTEAYVAEVLANTGRDDGRVRAMASQFVEGEPIGPWTHAGVREGDLNDVVAHEDRRELRGARLFAAWIHHFDARDNNTLASFIREADSARGYVRHYYIDFGESLGEFLISEEMSRRIGHARYVDPPQLLVDFVTLGAIERPWDVEAMRPPRASFPRYEVDTFDPLAWDVGTPNLAFQRMDDADAYWAARTISRFDDAHLAAIVAQAKLSDPDDAATLSAALAGRRDKIARAVFERVTPLDRPMTRGRVLALEDVAAAGGYADPQATRYEFRVDDGPWRAADRVEGDHVFIDLSDAGGDYLVVEARARRDGASAAPPPARFHLRRAGDQLQPVGVER